MSEFRQLLEVAQHAHDHLAKLRFREQGSHSNAQFSSTPVHMLQSVVRSATRSLVLSLISAALLRDLVQYNSCRSSEIQAFDHPKYRN